MKSRQQRQQERATKLRQEEAYRKGQEGGEAMAAAVDAYLTPRLTQLEKNLLEVFAQRLLTINDSPPHPPQLVARVEFKIFLENTGELGPVLN